MKIKEMMEDDRLRLIEILVLIILLPLFALLLSSGLTALASCEKKYIEMSGPINADRCIARSFKKICEQGAEEKEDFESFVRTLGSILPVTSLSVETVGIKDRKKLLRCSWTSQKGGNFVLGVCEFKEDL